jgi:N6-L-threonylcarbamoyladenine synthase
MRILGIETSCDETSAAIVEDGRLVLSNVIASQTPLHERFGGVVPEIASRQHVLALTSVTRRALSDAGLAMTELDALAVTYGPGLSGPLMVGTAFTKGLAIATGLPLIGVNHVEAHLLSVWLGVDGDGHQPPALPMAALLVSGGHTELVIIHEPGKYQPLGRTLDDAAGEAFDKVGRLLGLPYPGGPSIEKSAQAAIGEKSITVAPRAWLPGTYDFSFSGLKTAMVREVRSHAPDEPQTLDALTTSRLAAAFQESVADVLTQKLSKAALEYGARSAAIVGGVAANGYLRAMATERVSVPVHFPGRDLSTDNGAMIAGSGFWHRLDANLDLEISPSLGL